MYLVIFFTWEVNFTPITTQCMIMIGPSTLFWQTLRNRKRTSYICTYHILAAKIKKFLNGHPGLTSLVLGSLNPSITYKIMTKGHTFVDVQYRTSLIHACVPILSSCPIIILLWHQPTILYSLCKRMVRLEFT